MADPILEEHTATTIKLCHIFSDYVTQSGTVLDFSGVLETTGTTLSSVLSDIGRVAGRHEMGRFRSVSECFCAMGESLLNEHDHATTEAAKHTTLSLAWASLVFACASLPHQRNGHVCRDDANWMSIALASLLERTETNTPLNQSVITQQTRLASWVQRPHEHTKTSLDVPWDVYEHYTLAQEQARAAYLRLTIRRFTPPPVPQ